jgi:signal transduction histidine kinase
MIKNFPYPSTGIGLAVVRKVVANHEVKVWAESIEDTGATFNVLLPAE